MKCQRRSLILWMLPILNEICIWPCSYLKWISRWLSLWIWWMKWPEIPVQSISMAWRLYSVYRSSRSPLQKMKVWMSLSAMLFILQNIRNARPDRISVMRMTMMVPFIAASTLWSIWLKITPGVQNFRYVLQQAKPSKETLWSWSSLPLTRTKKKCWNISCFSWKKNAVLTAMLPLLICVSLSLKKYAVKPLLSQKKARNISAARKLTLSLLENILPSHVLSESWSLFFTWLSTWSVHVFRIFLHSASMHWQK